MIAKIKVRLFLALIVLGTLNVSCTQKDSPINQATVLVNELMTETQAVGITVSVGVRGAIVWSQGFGYADLEQKVPIYPDRTRFRVGSVSKPMTAMAVAQLYEQGLFDLDAPVQRYVPSFPEKQGTMTTRLLAGHLGGIRHYRVNENLSYKRYETVLDGLAIFKDDPLLHPPGSKYSYSSYGYNLLSAVVESASGENFLKYLEEHVFTPLGMNHTEADNIYSIIPDRGRYYVVNNGTIINAPAVDNSYKWAGGGLLSTSNDLVRFGFAHMHNDFLKAETIELLWTSQKTISGEKTDYGIGWRSGVDEAGRNWVGHNGGSVGGSTVFRVYPEEQTVIAMISNRSGQDYKDVPGKIAGLFIERPEVAVMSY